MTRHRFATLPGASVNQPRPTRSASRTLVERRDGLPELQEGRPVELADTVGPSIGVARELLQGVGFRRRERVAPVEPDARIGFVRDAQLHRDLVLADGLIVGPERQLVAGCEVQERRRQRPARGAPVLQQGAAGGRQLRGRSGQVDRRAVQHERVPPVAPPVEERVPGEEQEAAETADDPDHGVGLARELELGRPLCRGRGVDPIHRHQEGVVEPLLAQQRQHLLVVDLLALLVGEVEPGEARGGVELDLATHAAAGLRVDVHEDREAVVEAFPADAPLVDQRPCVLLCRVGRSRRGSPGCRRPPRPRSAPRSGRSSPPPRRSWRA